MNANVKPSNLIALLGVINPVSQGAGTATSGWVNAGLWAKIMAVLSVGTMSASSTVDAKIEQASDSGGTGAKDVTGSAIVQLTQAGTDSNKQVIIQVDPAALDINNGFEYVRLSVTVAAAASLISAGVFGVGPRVMPPTDATSVDEIVTVG